MANAKYEVIDGRYVRNLSVETVMEMIPHRFPLLLIDRVTEVDLQEQTCEAIKNVSMGEPIFQGHFPGHPILPGVMSIEALAQAATVYFIVADKVVEDKLVYFMTIDKARFRKPITPGDQLVLKIGVERRRGPVCRFWGKGYVDGELATEAEFSAMIVDKTE